MKELLSKYLVLLTVPAMFAASPVLMAQEPEAPSSCKPADLATAYDESAREADVTDQQLSIWYDYAREPYKMARYENKPHKYREAIPYYWKIIVNDQSERFKVVYAKLVDCYYNSSELDSALLVAFRGLEKYPDYGTLHYFAGLIFKARGQAECAIPHYEALVNDQESDPETLKNYWNILAQLYFDTEDERAIEAQQKLVELEPENVEASRRLAQIMDFFGMDPLGALESTFLMDTTNVENARRFGKAAFDAGFYPKSLRAYRAVILKDQQNIEARHYVARSYESLDKLSAAIRTYKDILEVDQKNLNALCAIASAYSRSGDFASARNYANRAKNIDPGYGWSYMVMGEIYENAVAHCSARRDENGYTYDDKLVFELAREEYQKALRDGNVAASAKTRIAQLEPFVRSKADIHMHKRSKIDDPCYNWIQ